MPFLNRKIHHEFDSGSITAIRKEVTENENGLLVVHDIPVDLVAKSASNRTHFKEYSLDNQLASGEQIKRVRSEVLIDVPDLPDMQTDVSSQPIK